MDSWLACHEFEPSTTEDPPCKGAMYVKSAMSSQTSCRCCGVVVKRGDSSGVVHVTGPWFKITRYVTKSPREGKKISVLTNTGVSQFIAGEKLSNFSTRTWDCFQRQDCSDPCEWKPPVHGYSKLLQDQRKEKEALPPARKRRIWFLLVNRNPASLIGLRGGWRLRKNEVEFALMDPNQLCPSKGFVLPNL
ncbi:hypothetical protein TNCV_3296951 [Trichonephila clavipes]|uniref:Uncharacterized protein n=1 Tax=Trichonephila clavipes TaxID=2585209 RepID=A0A8X6T1D3_TRICX|nr:hypothetical protein TNCV_3296951 [Trichonephila clavipes]